MGQLILIRHAQTEFTFKKLYCGFSNPPLDKKGIWQSQQLHNKLKDTKIAIVYSSDLKRAHKSACIIFKDRIIKNVPDFREMNFGVFEGLNYQEIIRTYPELYSNWLADPIRTKIPKGETLIDLSQRVRRCLSSILSKYKDETVAIVTHSGPIKIILLHILGIYLKNFWEIKQDICALNIIDYSQKLQPKILILNDTSHLTTRLETAL